QPFLLTDPRGSWLVKSGSLAVFSTRIQQGLPEGDRRHLFNVHQDEVVFGIAPIHFPDSNSNQNFSSNDPKLSTLGLVAVALEPTEVAPISIFCNQHLANDGQRNGKSSLLDIEVIASSDLLLENWIHKLGQTHGLPLLKAKGIQPQTQYVSLMKGERFQSPDQQMRWIRIQQGQAYWLGYSELMLTPETGWFPLGQDMWLQADDQLELYACNRAEMPEPQKRYSGLVQFHLYYLRCLELIQQQEAEAAIQQFQAKQALNRQVTQATIRGLASVLQIETAAFLQADSALLMAAGAVGKALGVTIQPPMKSEEIKRVREPLEAIARASRLRLRRVLLRDNWWHKDGSPIVAYTHSGRRPVALIPVAGSRYELFDPVHAGLIDESGNVAIAPPAQAISRTPVDQTVAATLEPVAYMFYRPLPDGTIRALDLLKFAFQGRQRDILTILLTGVAATLLSMLVPQATAVLVDDAIPYGNIGLLVQLGLALLAAALGGATFQLSQAIASIRIETFSDASMQAAVWDRLLKLRTSFFRQYSVGDLSARVSGISAIRKTLSGTALQSLFTGFFALLNLALLFYYSSSLATLALLVAIGVAGFTVVSGMLLLRKNRPLLELEGTIVGMVVQLISGVPKL
ncbi:MAG TPA: ABC transporter transmembrane domain-containing protein, partial [Allocoleopsis sp.]